MFNSYIKKRIDKNLSNYKKVVVWGFGGLGELALSKWLPLNKIEYVVDSNKKNFNKTFKRISCFSPKKIEQNKPDLIIVCSNSYLEIFHHIKKKNIKCRYYYIYELFLIGHNPLNELSNLYIDLVATKNCNLIKLLLIKPQVLVNISYRLARYFKKYKLLIIFYWFIAFLHYLVCMILSIQLPLSVQIGPGLIFAHPGTIVFTRNAKLGSFVTIYHCCTIGTTLRGNSPEIRDFVTIYTGSQILGSTILDSHSRVGAMSLLLDFKGEKSSTIAGIPAKIINKY